MKLFTDFVCVAALYVSIAVASLATFSPIDGIRYTADIPASTISVGSDYIYIQVTGPSSYQWISIGIGLNMTSATLFFVYADGMGNVTISPRVATDYFMPQFNADAQVTLLEGSGISNGVMTANFRCAASEILVSLSSTTTRFIGAYKTGPPLNSSDPAAKIAMDDNTSCYTLNLSNLQLSNDSNPLLISSLQSNSTNSSSTDPEGSDNSNADSYDPTKPYVIAHGTLMGVAMVILLPLGVIIMRLFGSIWIHSAILLFGFATIIAGFGIGIYLAVTEDAFLNCPHTTFGLVIVCLFSIQPLLGIFHHRQYLSLGRRSYFGVGHIWYGRLLILCGVINGGLGLQLSANTTQGILAYSIMAGVMFFVYIGIVVTMISRKNREKKAETVSS